MDSGFARDSNGHHGVSVGDADGDGLDDVYVAQPYGFPNRLYRARGDGTFEDVTEKAGLGLLEDTQHSLFADVDNDGDQDLLVVISSGPVLFLNDGEGRFERQPGVFRFEKKLHGRTHVDGGRRLRPRRLPRSLPERLLLPLRRGRVEGGHTHALSRRGERPPQRALPERRPRGLRRGHPRGGPRRGERPLQLLRRLGGLRRRRVAGPRGDERLRTEEPVPRTSGSATERCGSRTWRRRRASRTTRPG